MASNAVKKMKRKNEQDLKNKAKQDDERFKEARNRDEPKKKIQTANRRLIVEKKTDKKNQGGIEVDESDYLRRQKVVDMLKNRANFNK